MVGLIAAWYQQLKAKAQLKAAESKARASALSVYEGARRDRTSRDWKTHAGSADQAILNDLNRLIARSRQMVRDNPYATALVKTYVRNVVGTGITPAPLARFRNGRERQVFNRQALEAFNRWANDPKLCDAEGRKTFWDIQRMMLQNRIEAGQALLVFINGRDLGRNASLRLQVIEPEQLDQTKSTNPQTGLAIRGGVEIDQQMRPAAYWIRFHDTDSAIAGYSHQDSVRVPANRVIDLLVQTRPGQSRGVPELAAVLRRLRDLDEYDESERIAARMSACIGVIINSQSPTQLGSLGLPPGTGQDTTDANSSEQVFFEPGMVARGGPGEEIKAFDPARPGDTYADFTRAQLRAIGAGGDLSYEQITRDFSTTNFSGLRQAKLEDQATFRWNQQHMIHRLCQPVWQEWLITAAFEGVIDAPESINTGRFDDFAKADWQGPPVEWVDPLKQYQAYKLALDYGLKTRSEIYNEQGSSVGQMFDQLRDEQAAAADRGLQISHWLGDQGNRPEPEPELEPANEEQE